MKSVIFSGCLCALAGAAFAQSAPPTKVGVVHIQNALISTKEGQKAAAELEAWREPRVKELEKLQSEIQSLQDQLRKGSNTMSDEQKQKLIREIDQKSLTLKRRTEDAQAEFDAEQQRILQDLGQRMMAVIDKHARDNNYTLILDVSSPQTPVLYVSSAIDLTQQIIELYDKNSPAPAAAPAATAPAAASPAASKPAPVPSPVKRPIPAVKK